MEHKNIKQLMILVGIILVFFIMSLINTEFHQYTSIISVLLIIDILVFLIYCQSTKSPESIFKSKVKNIINTYDSILAKVDILPDLSGKDIVYIDKFEELINTQGETKKPIFYSVTEKTASFVLIDNNLVCYSIIKENENLIDPVESKLMIANAKKNIKDIDESILADLEQTTIIKLPNIGSYKVSPIRKKDTKKEEPVVNETKTEVEESKEEINEETTNIEETPVTIEENELVVETPKEKDSNKKKNHATERARKYREKQRSRLK